MNDPIVRQLRDYANVATVLADALEQVDSEIYRVDNQIENLIVRRDELLRKRNILSKSARVQVSA